MYHTVMVKVTINFLLLNDWFIGVLDLLGLFDQSLVAWIVSDRCFLEFSLYEMYQREREFARQSVIHVIEWWFIDAVNKNFASTFYICGLSMFWTYYMTVMFIFLLYIKDLRECYCECQNQCSRHDQLSLEAKWTSKHHHHHHHAFRLHR